jgi:gluconate 5-dehydrogenase
MINAQTFRLDGRLALVTGSSSGIGHALARGLAQAGAKVVLNGRNETKLRQAAEELSAEGLAVSAQAFDVCDPCAVAQAITQLEHQHGPLDILVNNAGIQRRGPFHEFALADWNDIMRTNVDSMFHVGQAVAKGMVARKRGSIINIASVQSELGRPGIAPYTASKGAVKMLTKGMAIDLGPHGVRVNALAPGYFKTELTEKLVADEAFTAWLVNRTPSRRWGDVQELAPAVVFLASDAASFVNGHILYVDGGVTATL